MWACYECMSEFNIPAVCESGGDEVEHEGCPECGSDDIVEL